MLTRFAKNAELLTEKNGIPYVLVSPYFNPQLLCVISELSYIAMQDQFELIHSGRVPSEV